MDGPTLGGPERKDAEEVGPMEPDETSLTEPIENVAGSVADEARFQRRRAAFRRRLASALIGVAVIVALVLWQRNVGIIQRCQASLEAYGQAAARMHIEREPTELMKSTWVGLKLDASKTASHYVLLPDNWLREPTNDAPVPLAMCAESHGSLTGRGRHVLYRTAKGLEVRWVDEGTAEKLLGKSGGAD